MKFLSGWAASFSFSFVTRSAIERKKHEKDFHRRAKTVLRRARSGAQFGEYRELDVVGITSNVSLREFRPFARPLKL
jgi:hypothetical protein